MRYNFEEGYEGSWQEKIDAENPRILNLTETEITARINHAKRYAERERVRKQEQEESNQRMSKIINEYVAR